MCNLHPFCKLYFVAAAMANYLLSTAAIDSTNPINSLATVVPVSCYGETSRISFTVLWFYFLVFLTWNYVCCSLPAGEFVGAFVFQGTSAIPSTTMLIESAFTSGKPVDLLRPICSGQSNSNITIDVTGGYTITQGLYNISFTVTY